MRVITRAATFILPFVLVGAGVMKFTTGHVFQYLEFQTGIELLHPFLNNTVGVAEIAAGVLIRFRRTRKPGSVLALAITGGAVATHLTPWLGLSPPTGLVDGATAPWTAADFTAETSTALFSTAIVAFTLALTIAIPELRGQSRARHTEPTSTSTTANSHSPPNPHHWGEVVEGYPITVPSVVHE